MAWQIIEQSEWPRWVVQAATDSVLQSAWRRKRPAILKGRTFLYRVTPEVGTVSFNGHDSDYVKIGRVEKRLRDR